MVFNDGQKQEVYSRLKVFGERHREILALYVFGSFLTYDAPEDIDVAVLLPAQAEIGVYKTQLRLLQSIRECVEIEEIDLLLLQKADPIIQMQVLRFGKLLFVRDERSLQKFIVQTLGAYCDLKQIRKPIEEGILHGRIYA